MQSTLVSVERAFGELTSNGSLASLMLVGRVATLGSGGGCDVCLDGLQAQHCQLIKSGRSVMLRASGEQTWVNGKLVCGQVEVRTGDVVRLADQKFVFTNLIPQPSTASDTLTSLDELDFAFEPSSPTTPTIQTATPGRVPVRRPVHATQGKGDTKTWFVQTGGTRIGPVTQRDLVALVRSGKVTANDKVDQGKPATAIACNKLPFIPNAFFAQMTVANGPVDLRAVNPRLPQNLRTAAEKKSTPPVSEKRLTEDELVDQVLMTEPKAATGAPNVSARPTDSSLATKPSTPTPTAAPRIGSPAAPVSASIRPTVRPPVRKPVKRTPPKSDFDFDSLKFPAIVAGVILMLTTGWFYVTGSPIEREQVVGQIDSYMAECQQARDISDPNARKEALRKIRTQISAEMKDVIEALEVATGAGSGHEADRNILFVVKSVLPTYCVNGDDESFKKAESMVQKVKSLM